MLIISHRGNLNGPNPVEENNPHNVMNVIYDGLDVEVDVWSMANGLFLGHDSPYYKIDYYFLVNKHLWIHCKNEKAIVDLSKNENLNIFYHENGICLTSKGYLWTAPGLLLDNNSIAVMPEMVSGWDVSGAYGVCTDYPLKYKR